MVNLWWVLSCVSWAISDFFRAFGRRVGVLSSPRQRDRVLAHRAARVLTRHRVPLAEIAGRCKRPDQFPVGWKAPSVLGMERAELVLRLHSMPAHALRAMARDRDDEVLEDARVAELEHTREVEERRRANEKRREDAAQARLASSEEPYST